MVVIVICLLTEKRSKADNENLNFPTQFCLGSTSNKFNVVDSKQVSSKRNLYGFSISYNTIDKSNMRNIRKYFMIKNNMK